MIIQTQKAILFWSMPWTPHITHKTTLQSCKRRWLKISWSGLIRE